MQPLLIAFALAQAPTLSTLQAESSALSKVEGSARLERQDALNQKVLRFVEAGGPSSAADVLATANLVQPFGKDFELDRVTYELTYAAAAMGSDEAKKALAARWDTLTRSLGRPTTLGAVKIQLPKGMKTNEDQRVELSPKCIRDLWLQPKTNPAAKHSAEIAKMFEEDQAARTGEMTTEKIQKMVRDDEARLARIKVMVKQGLLSTAQDFYYAAFLFQHGSSFGEYHTAHELSVCAMILGSKGAKWIGAASYDRMLHSCGHRQRWATQFSIVAGKVKIQAYDETGTSDFLRKLVVGQSLAEAKKREGESF